MTERIAIKLTQLIADIVPLNLSEAETENYPYAVYDYTPVPYYTKDGVYKYSADVELVIVSKDYDEAQQISDEVASALAEGMHDQEFFATARNVNADCTEGIWSITMNYTINQYK